jgi:hypothetical protein
MKLVSLSLAFFALFSTTAFALGDAGCGLGSMIFSENKKGHQILAATTNGTVGSQTFGISTGTSNCSAQGFVVNEKQIQHFAEANQADLTREMSQGQGEKLAVLAALYGCDTNEFSQMTQAKYGDIVTSANLSATDMVQNINKQELVKSCNL